MSSPAGRPRVVLVTGVSRYLGSRLAVRLGAPSGRLRTTSRCSERESPVGSVIKKRRKRMAKKKHRKLLKKTRVQRRKLGK